MKFKKILLGLKIITKRFSQKNHSIFRIYNRKPYDYYIWISIFFIRVRTLPPIHYLNFPLSCQVIVPDNLYISSYKKSDFTLLGLLFDSFVTKLPALEVFSTNYNIFISFILSNWLFSRITNKKLKVQT